jgi:sugar lactone lactonase YvrE
MSTRPRHALLAAALVLGLAAAGRAAGPVFWQSVTRADFLKGETDDLSIDSDGHLTLGPVIRLVEESTAPFLWALLPGPDGSVFAGSGNEGKVFRLSRDGKTSLFFDAAELEVHALAPAPDGGLYVASSPDGKVYKVDAKGHGAVFFDPDDKYIWALAVDAAGNVFAGTGEKGVIYKIAPDGKGTVFYRTRATHVLSLAFDKAGNLLAGTESPGRVFRIDPAGKAFVLLDSAYREIRALHLAPDGRIYVAAVGPKGGAEERPGETTTGEPAKGTPVPSVSTEITAISIADLSLVTGAEAKSSRREERRPAKGAVYRIDPDGTWDTVWESPDDLPYDLAFDAAGQLLVGTGNKGKIFRVSGDNPPKVTSLGRAAGQQVTRILPDGPSQMLIATANPGKLFRLSTDRAQEGSYESEVRDAETVATWGAITWRASTPKGSEVELFTRSGNSEKPDDTWSDWSAAYRNPDGEAITSPKARFLQWKAVLKGKDTPVLTSVSVAYLQRNLRPRVTSITVYPPGAVFQKPFSTGEPEIAGLDDGVERSPAPSSQNPPASAGPALGRRMYQKGLQTFVWKAEDGNDDRLQYDVFYRREGDQDWKTLKRGLNDTIVVWNTTAVPNGTYQLKVAASDAPSNPPGTALAGEMESTTFDIDNTPPVIRVTGVRREAGRAVLLFEVRDDQSVVQRVDYSVDAEHWQPIFPKDGLADSRFEEFEIPFPADTVPASVVLRAIDAMNNVATARGVPPAETTASAGKERKAAGKK